MSGSFDTFWALYPSRNGRKVGKESAKAKWKRLSAANRAEALTAVVVYAAEIGEYAKDPERFLKAGYWKDWLDAANTPKPTDGGGARVRERKAIECERCGDTQWVDNDDGDVVRCPDCGPPTVG